MRLPAVWPVVRNKQQDARREEEHFRSQVKRRCVGAVITGLGELLLQRDRASTLREGGADLAEKRIQE